ncbi:hypothetical protein [Candidatus Uabimicrobium sp. HlEnr_7]|uniref:hypothetical protein n=1 Tax=Candidatus Uabimicrobium helgolandensis TaxID=3095367 RepID=UPI003556CB9D
MRKFVWGIFVTIILMNGCNKNIERGPSVSKFIPKHEKNSEETGAQSQDSAKLKNKIFLRLDEQAPVKTVDSEKVSETSNKDGKKSTDIPKQKIDDARSPSLSVKINCPSKTWAGKRVKADVVIKNTGDKNLNDIVITGSLVTSIGNPNLAVIISGENNSSISQRSIVWKIDRLEAKQEKTYSVALLAKGCEHCFKVVVNTTEDVYQKAKCCIQWVGCSERLLLEVFDSVDPLTVNKETVYTIEVTNIGGFSPQHNVRIEAVFPKEICPISASGDSICTINSNRVVVVPYPLLQPKQKIQWKIKAKAIEAGDARVKVYVTSDYLKKPVTEEESTYVYSEKSTQIDVISDNIENNQEILNIEQSQEKIDNAIKIAEQNKTQTAYTGLSISVNDCPGIAYSGKRTVLSVTVRNNGNKDLTGVNIYGRYVTITGNSDLIKIVSVEGNPSISGKSITWNVGLLAPGEEKEYNLTVIGICTHCFKVNVKTAEGLSKRAECCTDWKGCGGRFLLECFDSIDPLTIGDETIYTIKITNLDISPFRNVKFEIVLPREMSLINVDGDTKFTINDKRITIFYPILQPKQKKEWKIQAKAVYPGETRVKIYMTSEFFKIPITEEEVTDVY